MPLPIARISKKKDEAQPLEEHLRAVSQMAGEFAEIFGGGELARWAGLHHDLGKYSEEFKQYIRLSSPLWREAAVARGEAIGPIPRRGSVDHASAGAYWAWQQGSGLARKVLAYVISSHHGGLINASERESRIADKQACLKAALAHPQAQALCTDDAPPLPSALSHLRAAVGAKKSVRERASRSRELFTRFLFSALCDADALDAERFDDPQKSQRREVNVTLAELAHRLTAHIEQLAASAAQSPVNRVRAEVRKACQRGSARERSVFTLTVPTGGGKTLAAMEFALLHAQEHGLRRVITALPFTSIIEQSAEVYRKAFGVERCDPTVLEHHASFDMGRPAQAGQAIEAKGDVDDERVRLAAENWDAPIVVTTTVQLLESLFANRPARCRKLHNVAGSVLILDEVQTLPRHLLAATTEVLEELVLHYGCSVVLCSATQPALHRSSLKEAGFERTVELMPEPTALANSLRRVEVDWSLAREPITYEALAERLAAEEDVLSIVHRRDDARALTQALDRLLGDETTFHLSALMCPEHRRQVLQEIRARKKRGQHVRLVATQLVEAGVDLDFRTVYRALAGFDSLAQAAGRCNREGKLDGLGKMFVFCAPTEPPKGILTPAFKEASHMIASGETDIFAPDVQCHFFKRLYQLGDTDVKGIQAERAALNFETVAKNYQLIDDGWSAPLIIAFDDEAKRLIRDLKFAGATRALMRQLNSYSISVSQRFIDGWLATGLVYRPLPDAPDLIVLEASDRAYDGRFGLIADRVGEFSADELVV